MGLLRCESPSEVQKTGGSVGAGSNLVSAGMLGGGVGVGAGGSVGYVVDNLVAMLASRCWSAATWLSPLEIVETRKRMLESCGDYKVGGYREPHECVRDSFS
jgi:hypothetical protein